MEHEMEYKAIRYWDDLEDEMCLGFFPTKDDAQQAIHKDFNEYGSRIFIREHIEYRTEEVMEHEKEYVEFLKSMITTDTSEESTIIEVMPNVKVAIKKAQFTPENKNKFINYVKSIALHIKDAKGNPKIHKGISHLDMQGIKEFHLEKNAVFITFALGKAYRVWDLIPTSWEDEMQKSAIENDKDIGMLPMITGFNPRGI